MDWALTQKWALAQDTTVRAIIIHTGRLATGFHFKIFS